jgi:hypothetical protein
MNYHPFFEYTPGLLEAVDVEDMTDEAGYIRVLFR